MPLSDMATPLSTHPGGPYVQDTGRLVTVGASDGSATLMELCEGLSAMQPNEKVRPTGVWSRQIGQCDHIEWCFSGALTDHIDEY